MTEPVEPAPAPDPNAPAPDAPPDEESDEPEGAGPKLDEISPADREVRMAATGEAKIVKSNPETPTTAQVEASQSLAPQPVVPKLTVGDGDVELRPDDAARLASTVEPVPEAFASEGHWSNPDFARDVLLPDEEKPAEEAPAEEAPAETPA
jgi:hypothetical protein